MKPKHVISAIASILGLMFIAAYVTGGDLNPDNTPSPTMRTLDELYKNIQPGLPSDWKPYPVSGQVTGISSIHMTIDGIQGSCQAAGKNETIVVVGLGHELTASPQLGGGGGAPILTYSNLIVTKYIDRSSPRLYEYLCQGRPISWVILRYYRTNNLGNEELYYTQRLETVYIRTIKTAFPNIEQIGFAYYRMKWEFHIQHPSNYEHTFN